VKNKYTSTSFLERDKTNESDRKSSQSKQDNEISSGCGSSNERMIANQVHKS